MANHIVLYQPEIPWNTGNIGRSCIAANATLHLIHPLGFSLDEKGVKRAGLDYWHLVDVVEHDNVDAFFEATKTNGNYYLLTRFGDKNYSTLDYSDSDEDHYFIFGNETSGLPDWIKEKYKDTLLRIPMSDSVRSLNLANTAILLLYEALRQQGYPNVH